MKGNWGEPCKDPPQTGTPGVSAAMNNEDHGNSGGKNTESNYVWQLSWHPYWIQPGIAIKKKRAQMYD